MKDLFLQRETNLQPAFEVITSKRPVILIELRGVYGLLAPNSKSGIEALNECKQRLYGKFYGSICGDFEQLKKLVDTKLLNPMLLNPDLLEGGIFRFPVVENSNNQVCFNRTHQILFENKLIRNTIHALEKYCRMHCVDVNFPITGYQGLLCTSANLSGDMAGSITSPKAAIEFAHSRNIELVMHTELLGNQRGSYPVFSYSKTGIIIEREGPHGEAIKQRINSLLGSFLKN